MFNDRGLNKEYLETNNVKKMYYNGREVFRRVSFTPTLLISTHNLVFANTGGTDTVGVSANTNWSVSTSASWLTITTASTGFSVTATNYSSGETERYSTITVSATNGDIEVYETIQVQQKIDRELPNVAFWINYNAKQYIPETHTIPQTQGQLFAEDMVLTIPLTSYTSDHITLEGQYYRADTVLFNRTGNNNMTVVAKLRQGSDTTGAHSIVSNRYPMYNWMIFNPANDSPLGVVFLHTQNGRWNEVPNITMTDTTIPNIFTFRVYNGTGYGHNYTTDTSSSNYNINWGSNANRITFFEGSDGGESWKGDFYWMYISPEALTDEQIQEVIDYNENL